MFGIAYLFHRLSFFYQIHDKNPKSLLSQVSGLARPCITSAVSVTIIFLTFIAFCDVQDDSDGEDWIMDTTRGKAFFRHHEPNNQVGRAFCIR